MPPISAFSERGQSWAFAVNSNVVLKQRGEYTQHWKTEAHTPLIRKNKLCRFASCDVVIRSRPVSLSRTAPVAALYLVNAFVAINSRVVPDIEEINNDELSSKS